MYSTVFMPVKCICGNNAVTESAELFSSFGKRCLIVCGKNGAKKSGALDDAISALKSAAISYEIFDEIEENPTAVSCRKAGEAARDSHAEFILGIGGGSALDASKAIAIYASNPELGPMDIYNRKIPANHIPVILIGTTAGTGSEVTGVSVLTNNETGIKKSISGPDCYAAVSFCCPKYTYSLPLYQTISTALDAFAHAVEGYFTPKCSGPLDLFAEKCIPDIFESLKKLSESKDVTLETREKLYCSSLYAGLVINTCGTAFPHPLGYILTENFGIPHGTACAAFFPAFITRCEMFAPEKAKKFFSMTAPKSEVISLIKKLTVLNGVEIDSENAKIFSERWKKSIPKNFLASPGGLTKEEAEKILASIGQSANRR